MRSSYAKRVTKQVVGRTRRRRIFGIPLTVVESGPRYEPRSHHGQQSPVRVSLERMYRQRILEVNEYAD